MGFVKLLRLLSDILKGVSWMDWGDKGGVKERCGNSGWVGEEKRRQRGLSKRLGC